MSFFENPQFQADLKRHYPSEWATKVRDVQEGYRNAVRLSRDTQNGHAFLEATGVAAQVFGTLLAEVIGNLMINIDPSKKSREIVFETEFERLRTLVEIGFGEALRKTAITMSTCATQSAAEALVRQRDKYFEMLYESEPNAPRRFYADGDSAELDRLVTEAAP